MSTAARSGQIIDISQKFGLDTSAFEQSVAEFAAILVDIDAEQVRRESSIPKTIQEITALDQGFEAGNVPYAISLKILPDHGVYGDTLSMAGTVDAPAGTGVRVFVDGRQIGNAATDQSGRFSLPYRIEQIEARAHTVYASVNPGISDVSTFTVGDGNTAVSLKVRLIEENGTSKCIGTGRLVTDGGVPVRGARVDVDIDGRASWGYGITGDDGTYTSAAEEITPRTHTVKAKFRPDGYPLNGSESASIAVDVPSHFGWIAALVYLMGVGGAAVGGVLFLRKRQPIDAPSSTGTTVSGRTCRPVRAPPGADFRRGAFDGGSGHRYQRGSGRWTGNDRPFLSRARARGSKREIPASGSNHGLPATSPCCSQTSHGATRLRCLLEYTKRSGTRSSNRWKTISVGCGKPSSPSSRGDVD